MVVEESKSGCLPVCPDFVIGSKISIDHCTSKCRIGGLNNAMEQRCGDIDERVNGYGTCCFCSIDVHCS